MFYGEKLVWVLHRTFLHWACEGTMTRIDPRFLSQLPAVDTERFPFVTTSSDPGMRERMVLSFVNFSASKILFGTCTDLVNELHYLVVHVKTKLT